jgi:hypothetical protein
MILLLLVSCQHASVLQVEMTVIDPGHEHVYEVGLGYGFLDKEVQVSIDGREVISLVGTEEIETSAQMQGTNMLVRGSPAEHEITVRVIVDGGEPYVQVIDLSAGRYVHIYFEQDGLTIYNTEYLIFE